MQALHIMRAVFRVLMRCIVITRFSWIRCLQENSDGDGLVGPREPNTCIRITSPQPLRAVALRIHEPHIAQSSLEIQRNIHDNPGFVGRLALVHVTKRHLPNLAAASKK
jgi:hypothetical protein